MLFKVNKHQVVFVDLILYAEVKTGEEWNDGNHRAEEKAVKKDDQAV
jgi:hypothetical protein